MSADTTRPLTAEELAAIPLLSAKRGAPVLVRIAQEGNRPYCILATAWLSYDRRHIIARFPGWNARETTEYFNLDGSGFSFKWESLCALADPIAPAAEVVTPNAFRTGRPNG